MTRVHQLEGCRCPEGSSPNFCLGTPLQPNEGSGIEMVMSEFDELFDHIDASQDFCGDGKVIVDKNGISVYGIDTVKKFLTQALTTIEKEAYRRGYLECEKKYGNNTRND